MNLLLFIILLIIVTSIVKIGAIALELTGLDLTQAQFQALSCFTGTGFTTKESELITSRHQRRQIASILMILGYAGFVTLIATFANSLRENVDLLHYPLPFLNLFLPVRVVPWINLLFIFAILYLLFRVGKKVFLSEKITDVLRAHLVNTAIIKPVSFKELSVATGGYGVCSIHIKGDNPLVGTTLHDLALRKHNIIVLAVEREAEAIPMPTVDTKIAEGDKLICFGNLTAIKKELVQNK